MDKAKRISRGSVGTMYALSSFSIDNSTRIHCAAWVTNLDSLVQLIIFCFLLRYLPITLVSTKSGNWISHNLKELNADKEACEAPAITSAREKPARQTEIAALSMQVDLPHKLYLTVMYSSLEQLLRYLLPFPNLAQYRPRVYLLGH